MAAFWLQKYQLIDWLKEYVSRSKIVKMTCHVIRARAWLCKFEDVYLCITFLSQQWDKRSMDHSRIQFSIQFENWCQFLIFMIFYHKKYESGKSIFFFILFFYYSFYPIFCRILNQYNNEVKNEAHRQSCCSDNVAVRDMAFFLSSTEVELIENWKLKFQSIFNIWFSAKTFQIVDRTTPGVHSHGTFFLCPQSPPHSLAS